MQTPIVPDTVRVNGRILNLSAQSSWLAMRGPALSLGKLARDGNQKERKKKERKDQIIDIYHELLAISPWDP